MDLIIQDGILTLKRNLCLVKLKSARNCYLELESKIENYNLPDWSEPSTGLTVDVFQHLIDALKHKDNVEAIKKLTDGATYT
jgi:hypothetical protein